MVINPLKFAWIISMFFLFFPNFHAEGQQNIGKIKCICIDPGHGGKDPGAVGSKIYEKEVVLKVALMTGELIKKNNPDIGIIYTRDKDVFIDLKERGKIANEHKAQLFISIHTNSSEHTSVTGMETYTLGLSKSADNLRVAMRENSVIQYEDDYSIKYGGFDPSKPESYMIFSMLQNLYQRQSLHIAELVQGGLIKVAGKRDRGVKQDGFLVLKDVAMPAILVELGFISNPAEEKYLSSKIEQGKMANALAAAFQTYKEEIEKISVLEKEIEQKEIIVEKRDGLYYAIQIASASAKTEQKFPLNTAYKVEELKTDDRYRYIVCVSDSYAEVKEKLKEVKKKIRDCFIIAVYNGKPITLSEANKLEKKSK